MKVGYARVSTEDQNLALQLDALQRAGCDKIFCDDGISGKSTRRPALKRALASLSPGDTLITWKLDRLGRNLDDLKAIVRRVQARGGDVESLTENVDTTTGNGTFIFHIWCAIAEYERMLNSERTSAGMAAAKARGIHVGRPRKLHDDAVLHAKAQIEGGERAMPELARALGVSPLTLARAMKRLDAAA